MDRYKVFPSGELGMHPAGNWTPYADAQATVEALQRERDEWRSNAVAQEARANDLERDCKDLLSDIDGERAKVGDLLKKIAYWEKRHRTYRELAEENMNCKQASIDAHKDAYDELESQHADHLAALRRAKAEVLELAARELCMYCNATRQGQI